MKKEIYSKDAGRDHMKEATESYDSLRDVRNILPVIYAMSLVAPQHVGS